MLAAPHRLFAERGYAGVGLEEVAAQAAVTRGAVYHHFTSKLKLFEAVLADVQHWVADAIKRETSGLADPWERLRVGCRVFVTASVADDVRRVLLVDAPVVLGWDVWRGHDAASSGRLLVDVLREIADAGELAPETVEPAAALLSGAMNEAALWVAHSEQPDLASEQAVAVLLPMLDAVRGRH